MKKSALVGCCGISCGLCPRFQSKAKSRCLGCGPDAHCTYCPIFRCSSMKRNFETCADCPEFPCVKFAKWFDGDSFVTHSKCLPNIQRIKKVGAKDFLKEQKERQKLLELMLAKYNPGQCVSMYCLACALIPVDSLKKALKQIESAKGDKAKAFKVLISELAKKEKISLKLRK